jgi:hypothetical protein
MKRYLYAVIFTVIGLLFLTGCKSTPSCLNVVPPEINLTGEKTVNSNGRLWETTWNLKKKHGQSLHPHNSGQDRRRSSGGSGDPEI